MYVFFEVWIVIILFNFRCFSLLKLSYFVLCKFIRMVLKKFGTKQTCECWNMTMADVLKFLSIFKVKLPSVMCLVL